MLQLLHYQENNKNKGSQMGHTKKTFKKSFIEQKKNLVRATQNSYRFPGRQKYYGTNSINQQILIVNLNF